MSFPAVLQIHYYRDIKANSVSIFCVSCVNSFTDNVFVTVSGGIISFMCNWTLLLLTLINNEWGRFCWEVDYFSLVCGKIVLSHTRRFLREFRGVAVNRDVQMCMLFNVSALFQGRLFTCLPECLCYLGSLGIARCALTICDGDAG